MTSASVTSAGHTRVWDPLVRTVHWSLAALIVVELFNEAGANPWHRYLGYVAAALVVLRLAWGCGNRGHASLLAMAARARQGFFPFRSERSAPPPGHTPLGALMAFALWTLALLVALTGWMQGLDAFWGDEQLQRVHEVLAYVLGGCALLHIIAALAASHTQGVNLVKAMITGNKPVGS